MADIVKVSSDLELGAAAHKNLGDISEKVTSVKKSFLELGFLFKENRDKKYYEALGYEKFEHFIGDPQVDMSRSMVFGLIQVHELYVEKLQRPQDELVKAGVGKLLTIAPVVEENPDEWIAKAQTLFRSDLKVEVAEAQGIEPSALPPAKDVEEEAEFKVLPTPSGADYVDAVKHTKCIICGKPAEPHHFPITRGAGGEAVQDWVIPLCRTCHDAAHADPKEWMWRFRAKWGWWFYTNIFINKEVPEASAVVQRVKRPKKAKSDLALPKPAKGKRTVDKVVAPPAPEEELSADADVPAEVLVEREKGVSLTRCADCGYLAPAEELEEGLCVACRK